MVRTNFCALYNGSEALDCPGLLIHRIVKMCVVGRRTRTTQRHRVALGGKKWASRQTQFERDSEPELQSVKLAQELDSSQLVIRAVSICVFPIRAITVFVAVSVRYTRAGPSSGK